MFIISLEFIKLKWIKKCIPLFIHIKIDKFIVTPVFNNIFHDKFNEVLNNFNLLNL